MEDHLVLCVDEQEVYCFNRENSLELVECRICQEDDEPLNLDVPCDCTGSLKYAHRKCVQRWCDEKGDTTCEICHQPYRPGYTSPQRIQADEVSIDIRGSWGMSRVVMGLNDSRLLAIAAVEHQFLEDEFSEYSVSNASGAACCWSAALTLSALLFLRSGLMIVNAEQQENVTTLFVLFLIRTVGFLLTCYLIVWAMNIVWYPGQRQEEAIAVADVALLMQAAQYITN